MFQEATEKWMIKSFQITIDGLKDFHDNRRILKGGWDTFSTILENINNIHLVGNTNFEIAIRMNVDRDNVNNISEFIKFLTTVRYKLNKDNWLSEQTLIFV